MISKKTILLTAVCCVSLALLACFASYLPFYIFDEEDPGSHTLLPLFIILGSAAIGIWICVRIRKHTLNACQDDPKARVPRQKPALFMIIRWLVMIIFAFLMIFGGLIFGLRMASISIPVLSCPWNREQMAEASCYYLTHLNELFELPAGEIAAFFGSSLGFVIVLGRAMCGFLCPIGLIQDIADKIRRKKRIRGIAPHERLYKAMKPIKWCLVILFLGLCFAGGSFCNFCPAITISPILAGASTSLYVSGFMMIFVLIGGFFKRRMWCAVCPLGYLVGLLHKISLFRIRKDCTACTECGACYEACPMGIKAIYTERNKTDVTDENCIMCGECVRCCPEDNALSVTFAGIRLYSASRKQIVSAYEKNAGAIKNEEG